MNWRVEAFSTGAEDSELVEEYDGSIVLCLGPLAFVLLYCGVASVTVTSISRNCLCDWVSDFFFFQNWAEASVDAVKLKRMVAAIMSVLSSGGSFSGLMDRVQTKI